PRDLPSFPYTTLFRSIDGRDLTVATEREWRAVRGTRVGAVFQDPASYLNPAIPVGRQLEETLRITARVPRRAARARARELLDDRSEEHTSELQSRENL